MKSLRPHLYRYVPKYFAKKYPKYVSLMENFLIFLETKNSLNFFDGTTERDHSIYNNIIDFDKHAQIDNLPVKNKDILNAYFKEYATTLDFRNQVLSFDEETMRMLAKFSGMVFNTKSSWSSYNLLFAIISTYLFNGAERGVVFKSFFNEDFTFDTEDAPDFYDIITVSDITKFSYSDFIKNATGSYGFVKLIDTITSQIYVDTYNGTFTTGDSLFNLAGVLLVAGITVDNSDSIGRNEIILSEYPLYKINIGFDGVEVDKNVITGKGTRPFEYQLISKSDLFVSGNFVSKLKSGFNPAGFKNEIIYVPEDIECETYFDSKIFSKVKFDVETYEPPEEQLILDGIGTIYLIGEFEDGVDYYALPNGDITTDITGIYLGVGNADGDIDLDIIEYEMTMTYPAGAEEIGLDIPFNVTATTNLQDGREVLIYAKKTGVTEHIGTATVSGGAISESVSIPSSAFTAEDTVTIELDYEGVLTDSNDVTAKTATITALTTDPESPEPATNFELSGESTYLVGEELTLQYSTDDSTWLPLGVATVQGDGTWSKADCQIADAGTYYLRAIYGAEIVESASITVTVESGLALSSISAGLNHSLGIWDGKVYAWGDNLYGQLGDGSTTQRNKPVAVAVDTSLAGKKVVAVSAGICSSYCVCDDGTVHAWGRNDYGQLGDGSTTQRSKPVLVDTSGVI